MNNVFEESNTIKKNINDLENTIYKLNEEKKYVLNSELKSMYIKLHKLQQQLKNNIDNDDIINQIVNLKIKINDIKVKIYKVYDEKVKHQQDLLDNYNLSYSNLKGDVEKLSTFNYNLMEKYILKLFNDFNYSNYRAVDLSYEYIDETFFDKTCITINNNKIITCINEKKDLKLYFEYDIIFKVNDYIDSLIKNGDAMLLSNNIYNVTDDKQNNHTDFITFYTIRNGSINSNVEFGKFKFVKDFIDDLIIYAQENEIVEVDDKSINEFYNEYMDKVSKKNIQRKKEKLIK